MTFSIGFIITFFNNKFPIEILRKIFYFVITDSIYMLRIRIYFPAACIIPNCSLLSKCPVIMSTKLSSFVILFDLQFLKITCSEYYYYSIRHTPCMHLFINLLSRYLLCYTMNISAADNYVARVHRDDFPVRKCLLQHSGCLTIVNIAKLRENNRTV